MVGVSLFGPTYSCSSAALRGSLPFSESATEIDGVPRLFPSLKPRL